MKRYILAIDEGTTSERILLFDAKKNEIVDIEQAKLACDYPFNGWVEQDAEEIFNKTFNSLEKIVKRNKLTSANTYGIGITNQRETTIAWNKKTGKVLAPAIVWQCRRTADYCNKISEKDKSWLKQKTGLVLDAYFSATKMRWLLDHNKEVLALAKKGELALGTVDAFLIYKLTKGEVFATDATNASRTMLCDLSAPLCYDPTLLKFFGIPQSALAEVRDNISNFGTTTILGQNFPIVASIGDQQSSLFGQGCYRAGEAKCTYGTGAFVLVNQGNKLPTPNSKLLSTVAWHLNGKPTYALEGSVFNVGSTIELFKNNLNLFNSLAELDSFELSHDASSKLYLVPAFTGLGAPYWAPNARGAILGMTLNTTRKDILRAGLESFAYSVYDILAELKTANIKIKGLSVDGGVSKNDYMLKFEASLIGAPVTRAGSHEGTALGAIFLTGLGTGAYQSLDDLAELTQKAESFKPTLSTREVTKLVAGWHNAVNRVIE